MREHSKSVASLSPALLARKGGARPAMRSGLAAQIAVDPAPGEDWFGAEVLPFERSVEAAENGVHLQQQRLAEAFPAAPSRPRQSALSRGDKAAFTLRLDEERHLRLRLACTASNRSAQQVVTEALDRLLADMPELEAIAGEMRRKRHS